eukprot:g1487.t1
MYEREGVNLREIEPSMAALDDSATVSESGELVLAYRGLDRIPGAVAAACAAKTTLLNLTENAITSSEGLEQFTMLETLILDKNNLKGLTWCCPLPSLKTLYFNNNDVSDVEQFVSDVARLFPALEYLSMMRNPCCPEFFTVTDGSHQEDYRRHREYVLFRLPGLQFLDATDVTAEEVATASRRGSFLGKKARPTPKKKTVEHDAALAAQQAYEAAKKKSPPGSGAKSPTSFLGVGHDERYDGSASEGNRFITDDDL